MSQLLLHIEPSPNYPTEDISEGAADILSLLLQNSEISTQSHTSAETAIPFYGRSHRAIARIAVRFEIDGISEAMDIGASTYEAISAMVNPRHTFTDINPGHEFSVYKQYLVAGGILPTISLLESAKHELETKCPNTAYVVKEIANRHNHTLTSQALMAAGLSRSIELDILKTA